MSLQASLGHAKLHIERAEFFHQEAALILQHLSRACLQACDIAHENTNRIVVGVTEAFAYSPLLAAVISRYRAKWLDIQLVLSQKQVNEFGVALKDSLIDATFTCPLSNAGAALSCVQLAEDRMILAVPAVHPFARRLAVSLLDLKNEPLILVAHDQGVGGFEDTLRAGCQSHGFAPRIIQTNPKLMLALNVMAAGVGFAFVPEYMSSVLLDDLCCVPTQDFFPSVPGVIFVTRTGEV